VAITFIQAKENGSTTGTSASATFTSAPTAGNLLVAWVISNTTTVITNAGGWTPMTSSAGGTGGSTRSFRGFYKIAAVGESSSPAFAVGSGAWGLVILEYQGVDGVTPLLIENSQLNASGTVTTPTVTPTASKEVVISFALGTSAGTNTTFSAEQINASATGVNERADVGAGAHGGKACDAAADLFVASTTGTYQGSATASAAGVGAGGIAIFQAAVVTAFIASPPEVKLQAVNRVATY
jgi:hypothetical protein